MNTAIAQSATDLALSTNGEANYDFRETVKRVATRAAKGLTRESRVIKRNTLITGVCQDYRLHFAAVYGKSERLPSEVFTKVEQAVDEWITSSLGLVNANNAVSVRRAFAHKANDLKFVERVIVTGENELSLAEQKLGVTIAITAAERRLRELQSKKTPDFDREQQVKVMIAKLENTKNFVLGEIAHQEKLASESKVN